MLDCEPKGLLTEKCLPSFPSYWDSPPLTAVHLPYVTKEERKATWINSEKLSLFRGGTFYFKRGTYYYKFTSNWQNFRQLIRARSEKKEQKRKQMEAAKGHIFLDGVGWWKLPKTWPSELVPLVQFTFFHNLLPLLHFNPHLFKKKKATIHNWHSITPCCLYLPCGEPKPRADNKSYSEWQTREWKPQIS